jgi:hypothetical protein
MKRLVMLGLVLLAPTAPRAAETYGPAAPVYKEIADWIVACDNTRTCVAKAAPADDSATAPETPGYIRLERAGGASGAAEVRLTADNPFTPDLWLDGKPLAVKGWTYSKADDAQELKGEAALAFMRLIRNGSLLQFGPGKTAPAASLKGLTATLLAMDEAQGRIGNVSALGRPGPAPASATPAAPAPPVVKAAPFVGALPGAKALAAAVRRSQAAALKSHDCDAGEQELSVDEARPLTKDEAVVTLGCITGAYQGSSLSFRVARAAPGKAVLLVLPHPPILPADAADTAGEYTEGGYDPKTATFSESAKGRGIADCGVSESWVFDGQAFHLSALAYQERCGGGEPGDWPTLYRTVTR